MNEIGRERRALLHGVDLRLQVRIADINALGGSHELFPLELPVRLNNWKTHGRGPDYRSHLFNRSSRVGEAMFLCRSALAFRRFLGSACKGNFDAFRGDGFGDETSN